MAPKCKQMAPSNGTFESKEQCHMGMHADWKKRIEAQQNHNLKSPKAYAVDTAEVLPVKF